MNIKDKQIEYSAAWASGVMTAGGLTPALLGQIVAVVQREMLELEEVDNSDNNGILEIEEPESGVYYRALYPVPGVEIGELGQGETVTLEFTSGAAQGTFYVDSPQEVLLMTLGGGDWADTIRSGWTYQVELKNWFGRVFGTMVSVKVQVDAEVEESEEGGVE